MVLPLSAIYFKDFIHERMRIQCLWGVYTWHANFGNGRWNVLNERAHGVPTILKKMISSNRCHSWTLTQRELIGCARGSLSFPWKILPSGRRPTVVSLLHHNEYTLLVPLRKVHAFIWSSYMFMLILHVGSLKPFVLVNYGARASMIQSQPEGSFHLRFGCLSKDHALRTYALLDLPQEMSTNNNFIFPSQLEFLIFLR